MGLHILVCAGASSAEAAGQQEDVEVRGGICKSVRWHDGLRGLGALFVLHPVLRGHRVEGCGYGEELQRVRVGQDVEGVEGAGVVEELEAGEDDDSKFGGEGIGGHVDGFITLIFELLQAERL